MSGYCTSPNAAIITQSEERITGALTHCTPVAPHQALYHFVVKKEQF
ncbi:hypothetical protein [Candidatus Nitrotoga sp. AM1P]|nr:hypothetical protein [Candidatus Nitrotoga sp. AM1P]